MLLDFQRDFAAAISAPVEGPMRIYRNTVLSGCVDALHANYPAVARLLGDEMFDAVAAEHAAAYPPRRPSLALYGDRFPDWLEVQHWVGDLRYLPDVARIERLYIEALFAPDTEPLQMPALSRCEDWDSLKLEVHPATRFEWLTTPAMSIWLRQRAGDEGELELDWVAEGVLITRPSLAVDAARLDGAGYRFLFGIRSGESVAAAAVAASALGPAIDIGVLFTSFVNAGAFAAKYQRSLP